MRDPQNPVRNPIKTYETQWNLYETLQKRLCDYRDSFTTLVSSSYETKNYKTLQKFAHKPCMNLVERSTATRGRRKAQRQRRLGPSMGFMALWGLGFGVLGFRV